MEEPIDLEEDRREYDHAETLRLISISVGLTADNLEESLEWYCGVLGFHLEETYEHDGKMAGASLVAGSQRIVISQDNGEKGLNRKKGQGIRLYLQSKQEVDRVAQWIKARGGQLETEPEDQPWGARTFNLVDPSGFLLTITS